MLHVLVDGSVTMASPTMHTPTATDASLTDLTVKEKRSSTRDYRGFVAGVFSGLAKLTGAFISCYVVETLLTQPNPKFWRVEQ